MTTVALSLVGVLIGLVSFGMPFSIIMTGIAVICLAGVVVKNAIVLLAYTRQLQARGMDLISASVEAGATRLRPVLLTAATTVLGLVPMAAGVSFDFHTLTLATRSESSEWWRNMAVAVIFGLTFATLLTLVVVPTLYVSLYRLAAKFGLGGLRKPAAAEAPVPLPGPAA
jgi:multidrug efflux pump subunit AcrB